MSTIALFTTASGQFVNNELVLQFVKTTDTAEFRAVGEKYGFRIFLDEQNHFMVSDGDSFIFKKHTILPRRPLTNLEHLQARAQVLLALV